MANKINKQKLEEIVRKYGKKSKNELIPIIKNYCNSIACNIDEDYCILFNKLIYSIILNKLNKDEINQSLYARNIKITTNNSTNVNKLVNAMFEESIFDDDDYIDFKNKVYIKHFDKNKVKCIDYDHYKKQVFYHKVNRFYNKYGYGFVDFNSSNIDNFNQLKKKIKNELDQIKKQSFEILFCTKINGVE